MKVKRKASKPKKPIKRKATPNCNGNDKPKKGKLLKSEDYEGFELEWKEILPGWNSKKSYKGEKGRPTKLTPAVAKKLLYAITLGMTYERASEYVGIAKETFLVWRKRGEKELDGFYHHFVLALKKAEIQCERNMLDVIERAAKGGYTVTKTKEKMIRGVLVEREEHETTKDMNWTAAMTLLERRFPKLYGRNILERLDPAETAKAIAEATEALFGSVPLDEDGGISEDDFQVDDDKVDLDED